ncbi:hypothetical protein EAE99_003735 [Botrytis elliptica]|nr:hypothetical protein EAE99_003735 [Botrytis elliptica]
MELAARQIWDPKPGTIRCRDLVNYAKDGIYAKDLISDYVQGVLILAKETKTVFVWEAGLFQWPFVRGMKVRKGIPHLGHPFTDPDGKIMRYHGRLLYGNRGDAIDTAENISQYTFGSIQQHPKYDLWLREHLFAKRDKGAVEYLNSKGFNTKSECEQYINVNRNISHLTEETSIMIFNSKSTLKQPLHG